MGILLFRAPLSRCIVYVCFFLCVDGFQSLRHESLSGPTDRKAMQAISCSESETPPRKHRVWLRRVDLQGCRGGVHFCSLLLRHAGSPQTSQTKQSLFGISISMIQGTASPVNALLLPTRAPVDAVTLSCSPSLLKLVCDMTFASTCMLPGKRDRSE